jgi:tetratricopeptide (TPR) repeat protein
MSGLPRLRDIDAAERAYLLKVTVFFGPACFIMLSALWFFMLKMGWIPGWLLLVLILLNIPLTIAGIFAIHHSVGAASTGFVRTVFAAGDIKPPPTYPRQDVLIVQGKYEEAADWFRDHIRIEPYDHEARLRLALLLETHLKQYDEAEQLYLKIRNATPPGDARQQMQAANHLIDLYRKTGRTDRLLVELARFVDRYRGSPQAAGAERELKELKAERPTSESRRSPR